MNDPQHDLALVQAALDRNPKHVANDVRAVRRFYRAMETEPFNTQMAAIEWLGKRFVRDKDRRMLATATATDETRAAPFRVMISTRRRLKARILNRVIRWTLHLQALLDRELDRQ